MTNNSTPFLDYNGNYYWFEGKAEEGDTFLAGLPTNAQFTVRFDPLVPPSLMTCRLDGSSRRLVREMRDSENEPVLPLLLFVEGKSLYLLYRHPTPGKKAEAKWETCLGRLNLDDTKHFLEKSIVLPEVKELKPLPEPAQGGYFYFVTEAERKSLLDFAQSASSIQTMRSLWRVRLP